MFFWEIRHKTFLALFIALDSHAALLDCIDGDRVLVLLVVLALVQVHVVRDGAVDVLVLVLKRKENNIKIYSNQIKL